MAKSKKIKQSWMLFIVTFLISLIVITYFIKSMSPDVDVEIGGEEVQQSSESTESDIKKAIDDRLRWIQMEDNMPGVSKRDEITGEENESETVTKDKKDKSKDEKVKKQNDKELEAIEYVNPQMHKTTAPTPPTPAAAPSVEPVKMSKVYVGSYATIEQAIQAQNKLMSSSASVSPFVKEVNGMYVLQAGSYANAGKAESVSRELNSLGFSARVVKE